MTLDLMQVNSWEHGEAVQRFTHCCGAARFAAAMVAARPFTSAASLHTAADRVLDTFTAADWLEAFGHHPEIGDIESLRRRFASSLQYTSREQSGVQGAPEEVLAGLARLNREYRQRHGFIFIVCATGKSAAEMLGILQSRIGNPTPEEIRIAGAEQRKITHIRLDQI